MVDLPRQVQQQAEALAAFDAEQTAAQAQPAPPDPAETPPAQEPIPTPPEAPPSEDWRQKYLSLQGMFNTTAAQLREAAGREQLMKGQVDQLSAQLQQAAAQQPPKAHDPTVTAKDVETFGSDLLDAMKRSAVDVVAQFRAEISGELAPLKAQVAHLERQAKGTAEVVGHSSRQGYFRELARLVPDYEAVNADQRFLSWLSQADPMAGVPRQAFLSSAFDQMDAERTAKLFNAWKTEIGALQAAPAPNAPSSTPRPSPAPSTNRVDQAPAQTTAGKVWTSAEIDAVYRAAGRGEYRGKEADFAKITAEIDLALEQGRVRM